MSVVNDATRPPAGIAHSDAALLLYYDEYHTPIAELKAALPLLRTLFVDIGGDTKLPDRDRIDGSVSVDFVSQYANQFLLPAIRANARYQEGYNLSAALARPALALAAAARAVEGSYRLFVHGFAGNDQVRFEGALSTLCPGLRICSVKDLIGSRTKSNDDEHTRSSNLWGHTIEAGPLADLGSSSATLAEFHGAVASEIVEIELTFEAGTPVALNGNPLPLDRLILELNALGACVGVRGHDIVEDGFVGLKTRALYWNPASDIIIEAHRDLASVTSSRRQNLFRPIVEAQWATLVYEGGWFDPFRETLDHYFEVADRYTTGVVTVRIEGGRPRVVARRPRDGLYDERHCVYRAGQDFGNELVRGLGDQLSMIGRLHAERQGVTPCAA